jgi:hypothetical protein
LAASDRRLGTLQIGYKRGIFSNASSLVIWLSNATGLSGLWKIGHLTGQKHWKKYSAFN